MTRTEIFMLIAVFFTTSLLGGTGFTSEQNTKIDSIKQLLVATIDDSSRAELLLELGSLVDEYAPRKSIDYANEALELFSELNNMHGRARALNKLGYNHWQIGKFLTVIKYYKEALVIFEDLEDISWIARVSNNLGAVYWGLSDYNKALDLYQKALKIRRKENDQRNTALVLNNIGLIYQEWNLIDQALEYHNEALNISTKNNIPYIKAYSYNNLGRCYADKKDYEKALDFFQLSYRNYVKNGNYIGATSLALKNIGDIQINLNAYNSAISYYQKSFELAKQVNNEYRIAIAEYNLGRTYKLLNQLEIAHKYAIESLKKAHDNGYDDLIRDNYYLLSEIEENSGNIHKAFENYKNASAMKDSIFNTKKVVKFTKLQIDYNLEKKNTENELLRKNNKIQVLSIRRYKHFRNIIILIVILILIILWFIYNKLVSSKKINIILKNKNVEINKINSDKESLIGELQKEITKRKTTENELNKNREHLEDIVNERTKKLKETQEQLVRKEKLSVLGQLAGSIGHDLRNPLGVISNSIYFLNMKIKDKDEKVKKHLDMIQKEVEISNSMISELMDFSKVGSLNIIETNVNELIKGSINEIVVPKHVKINLNFDEKLPKFKIDPYKIQRAFQNLIINAIQAMNDDGKLEITTNFDNEYAEIRFKDNGSGIKKEDRKRIFEPLVTTKSKGFGLGLAIVKSIIDTHNGKIDVESEVGKGTTFIIKLPLK